MKECPLVSVITPSWNQAQFIEETLLSVKGQDYANLEHIVIDGGSTDGTVGILRRYEEEYNLRWVSEPDEGQSDGINKGFRMAGGEIIGWLNSDDTYMPGAVSTAVECLMEHPEAGWVHGDGYWIDEHSQVLDTWESTPSTLKKLLCNSYSIVQPTVFFRKGLLRDTGYLDLKLDYVMDVDFFYRLALVSRSCYTPQVLATRRLHDQAKTKANKTDFIPDRFAMLDKLFERSDLPKEIRQVEDKVYSRNHLMAGFWAFVAGDVRASRRHLWRGIKLAPNPFRMQVLKGLITLTQSYLGIRWYVPGQRTRARRRQRTSGDVSVKWTRC